MSITYVSLPLQNICKVYLSSAIGQPSQTQNSDEQEVAGGSENNRDMSDAGTF